MTTEADIGHGIKIQRNDGDSPNDWVDTGAELRDVSGPDMSKDTPDATHMLSPNRFREFISGLIDGGEFTASIAFIPGGTTWAELFEDFKAKDLIEWRLLFPDGTGSTPASLVYDTAWRFSAHISALSPAMPLDDSMVSDVTWKVSGEPILESTA